MKTLATTAMSALLATCLALSSATFAQGKSGTKHTSNAAAHTHRNVPAAPKATKATTSRTAGFTTASSGSCSCGASDVCTGARGGRYCYTASGKKKYL